MLQFVVVVFTLLSFSTSTTSTDMESRTKRQSWTSCTVNGVTYQEGEYFTVRKYPCLQFRCHNGGYQVEIWECQDNNKKCHALNSEKHIGCTVFRCEHKGAWIGFVPLRFECRDSHGQCHPLNYEITTGCNVQRCERRGSRIGFYRVNQGPMKCMDANGACHAPGSGSFPYRFKDGRFYRNCICKNSGTYIYVQCL